MKVKPDQNNNDFTSRLSLLELKISNLSTENENLKSTNEVLTSELEIKDQQIAILKYAIFVKKSKKKIPPVCEKQLSFLFDEAELNGNEDKEDVIFRRKKKAGRKKLPKNLPRNL